ncbi:betaine--homocysteine S-methyltransferase [Rhizobium lusitanum]|uniref:5-methyltetrahydrofolate--homocysteine methyltransferase n=1 Tax=Rhizobium lusitanum TaxID=293958 RepID=A0A7X0IQ29_9HYPH|nr:betaine--homocysteine S-methyltransferase [Rhizobium lusitanum]MBB6485081.1 5-methyltetrahydrofolate--homocysteine methyltransferase [Rhizobium lusitanum]
MPTPANPLAALLAEKGVLLADGAMGTSLFALGLEPGQAPELWNERHPELVVKLHRDFIQAGADIILTNSFGGTHHRLKLHHAQERVHGINKIAAEIARSVADEADRTIIVAGSVGPTGEPLMPTGALAYEDTVSAFVEQIEGLQAGGVDIVWIETMSSPHEIRAAAEAAVKVGLPYIYTASFHVGGRTMAGLHPEDIHGIAADIGEGPLAVGANCGTGPADTLASLLFMTEANPSAAVAVKSNCGIPEAHDGQLHYPSTPRLMADYASLARDAGARIIGGCCGTSCDHLAAMRQALDDYRLGPRPTLEAIIERIGPLSSPGK